MGGLRLERIRAKRSVRRREPNRSSDVETDHPGKCAVSKGGGFAPRWRTDGRELFYRKADGSVMAIATNDGAAFSPRATTGFLFAVPGALPDWGVTPDGSRFLFAVPVSAPQPYQIVRDWQALLSN